MLKIMTFNANGIRSAHRKGFFQWFLKQDVDVLCIQETKAQDHQMQIDSLALPGYQQFLCSAEKPGYSGVAIYSRKQPTAVLTPLDGLWTSEGRLLGIQLDKLEVYSLYLPSGTSGDARQAIKYQLMSELKSWMKSKKDTPVIVAGDWNIAHQRIDLKNWQSNQKNSGFLPEEREWLTALLADDWVDAFRVKNQSEGQYTWWTYRANARANNVGWRIDYQIMNQVLQSSLQSVHIDPLPIFSDHAPLSMVYDIDQIGIKI